MSWLDILACCTDPAIDYISAQRRATQRRQTSLRLVATLCDGGAKSIAQLTSGTVITRQGVTKHLQILSRAGLVKGVKAGRERVWEFEPARFDKARRSLDLIATQWEQALGRLKTLVEHESKME